MAIPFLFFLLFTMPLMADSQPQWTLIKDKNGIKVYTANSEKSNVKKVKVIAVLEGSIREFAQIIQDVENQKKWVYGTKRSYILKRNSPEHILYYVETDLPWPISNRDVAIQMNTYHNERQHTLKVTSEEVPDAIQKNKGIVRVKDFEAVWVVTEENPGKIKINYELYLDPGGSLPATIVNRFITKGPYETFTNLAVLLKK